MAEAVVRNYTGKKLNYGKRPVKNKLKEIRD
jgi:hypothetical protein